MKIGVIGDVHIGAGFTLGKIDPETQLNSRLLDYQNTFNSIIDKFVDRQVEVVVLTGDVFESRNPHPSQLNILCKCLTRATSKGLKIYIVVGNHDQTRGTSTTTIDIFNHLQLPNIQVFQEPAIQSIEDFHLIFMPFRDRIMMNVENNENAYELIKTQVQSLIVGKTGTKILIGHFMLENTAEGDNPDSFGIKELVLPLNIFQGVDVVVMGHIHKHEIKSPNDPVVIYSGSMEKNNFGERETDKISIVLNTEDPNNYEILKSDVRPLFDLVLDYSEEEPINEKITEKILSDLDEINHETPLKDGIVRLTAKVNGTDLLQVRHQKIKEHLYSKGIHNLVPLQISATSTRQFRNKSIDEHTDSKKAMAAFLDGTSDSVALKEKLQKAAVQVIEQVRGADASN